MNEDEKPVSDTEADDNLINESQAENSENNSDADQESGGAQEESVEVDAPVDSIESLKAEVSELQKQLKEEALRAQAEIQNIRRRAERDVANAHKFGQEKLIKELLAVVDSLERGLQTIDEQNTELDETAKVLRDGSELTLKMFLDALAKFEVKQIDPHGEPFDPQFHEAMSMIDNPDVEPNTVIAVVQKGFSLNERLVRPAMVVVSKA